MNYLNVFSDLDAQEVLYNYCDKNNWINHKLCNLDNFHECILDFFGADPDLFIIDGTEGYFCICEDIDTVFYYCDDWENKVPEVLENFVEGDQHLFHFDEENQSFDHFYASENAIAFRNGCGYIYKIYDLTFVAA